MFCSEGATLMTRERALALKNGDLLRWKKRPVNDPKTTFNLGNGQIVVGGLYSAEIFTSEEGDSVEF